MVVKVDEHYIQKSRSLHGLAKDYAENEGVTHIPYQILVSELLSLVYLMEYFYDEEGKNFLWQTVKAYTSQVPANSSLTLGEELHTLGDILRPVYTYLEKNSEIEIPKLSQPVLDEALPKKERTAFLHTAPHWNDTVSDRDKKVYEVHVNLDEDDEWSAAMNMYHADVLGFQLWLMKYSELITEQQAEHLNESGILGVKKVGEEHDLGADNLGRIFYDIMWDLTLKALQDLGEISEVNLEHAMKLWRSRFAWIAGPDNTEPMLIFLNNHIPEKN